MKRNEYLVELKDRLEREIVKMTINEYLTHTDDELPTHYIEIDDNGFVKKQDLMELPRDLIGYWIMCDKYDYIDGCEVRYKYYYYHVYTDKRKNWFNS